MAGLHNILRTVVTRRSGATARAGPTVAMYFLEPLAERVGDAGDGSGRPILRHSPTLYSCAGAAVVVRYAGAHDLAMLLQLKPHRVFYIIDDDLFAAGPGDGLPWDYRHRLIRYRNGPLARLLALVSDVVAPNQAILAGYPGKRGWVLAPCCCHRPGGLGHHRTTEHFEIVLAGTRAHGRDVAHLAAALARFLRDVPDAGLTTLLGREAPAALKGLANAVHLTPMDWQGYRRFVADNRFHVALSPSLDTVFNRSRSHSKLHDHAGFGAAGLYSNRAPFAGAVQHGVDGLLLDDAPATWLEALRLLHADRAMAKRLAASGQRLSRQLGEPGIVKTFWSNAFGLQL